MYSIFFTRSRAISRLHLINNSLSANPKGYSRTYIIRKHIDPNDAYASKKLATDFVVRSFCDHFMVDRSTDITSKTWHMS